jgi:hypothetical protein
MNRSTFSFSLQIAHTSPETQRGGYQ